MVQGLTVRTIMILGLLVGLSQLGFELGPILAGLGIAGFIVGFALQDSLSNFAAGVMILGYRPFDIGDMVEAGGVFGRVHNMSLVSTTILTIDNQTLIVPNSKIWGDVIKNVTDQQVRRIDMKFRVAISEDVERIETLFLSILEAHPKTLEDPPPAVKLHELGEWAMEFVVRPWVRTPDYWEVYWELTREIKRRLDAEGIEIPVPVREVRLRSDPA
jgi:small conductance mechanosensitive channel